jgi:hypothetical protein
MATMLDEFIIKIGLDGNTLNSDVAKTRSNLLSFLSLTRRDLTILEDHLKKTQTETGKRLQQVEAVGRSASQQFNTMKNNVLGFLGAIAGAYSLQAFTRSLIGSDAALGNFSKSIGVNVEDVATWIEMGKRAGASAESVKTSFVALNQIKQDFLSKGTSPTMPIWQAMGIDPRGKSEIETLKQLSDWAKNRPAAEVRARIGDLGLPPDMVPLIMKGREAINQLEKDMRALGVATARSAEEDQRLLNQFANL